jgi:hypothetical protein
MKNFTLLLLLLPFLGFSQTTDLFISQYGEGTSYNKYIEIYNGTGASVDLTAYSLKVYNNGALTPNVTFALTGTLADQDVYIVANSAANATILALADANSNVAGFNGDDAVILEKNSAVIDVIGFVGTDPGTSWTVAGDLEGSLNKTLIRKQSVCSPNADWAISSGTDAASSEWIIGAVDDISNLGIHTSNCGTLPCATLNAPVAVNATICGGATATISATASETNSTLYWFDVATNGTALGTGASYTTNTLNSTTSFWVEEAVTGCPPSPRTEVIVTVSGIAPVVSGGIDQTVCAGETVTLTASGTGTISWNNGITDGTAFIPTSSATYTITLTNGACSNTDQVLVTVNPLPTVSAGADQTVCAGASVSLNGSGVTNLSWDNGVTDGTSFIPTVTNTYTVTGTDGNQCTNTDQLTVTVNPLPTATASPSNSTTLVAGPTGENYQWINCANNQPINGATNASFTATMNGSYAVQVTNSFGCSSVSNCVLISVVGINENKAESTISVFPNPTKGKVNLTIPTEQANILIYNALGKIISNYNNLQNGATIDLSNNPNGVYLIHVATEKGTSILRVVRN